MNDCISLTWKTRLAAALAGWLLLTSLPGWSSTLERPDADMRTALQEAINSSDSFQDRFDAEVWLTDMSVRLPARVEDPAERLTILKRVHYEAKRAGLEPELVLALIQVESNFDRFAISSAGARGLMQIMPFYLQREKGDMRRALARYNGSVGKNWYPRRVYTALRKRWYRL